jgi:hypothetical protein
MSDEVMARRHPLFGSWCAVREREEISCLLVSFLC